MAKIRERNKGREDGGYTRIFDNKELGALLSQVHATSISAGTELEKMIFINDIEDLDKFLLQLPEGHFVKIANKATIKKSILSTKGKEADGIIFIVSEKNKVCYIIELKDGDTFDTKKVDGEIETLKALQNNIAPKLEYKVEYYICGFNSSSRAHLKTGLKSKLSDKNLMTGKELCELIGINYNEIINMRRKDARDNMEYFLDELIKIDKIREILNEKLKIQKE